MHKVSISQSVIDRVVARRGREHIFDNLAPAKTALVVVDMQNGFMVPELGHAACAMAHEIVPNINRLAKAVRDTGGKVIWIQTAYHDETLKSWSISYEMVGKRGAERRKFSLSPQNKGYEIFPDLKIESDDLIVVKNRYSAFIQGSSNIEEVLNEPRPRHAADHRHRHQRLLRVDGARRHDAELPDHHDHRRQRRQHRRGSQRRAEQLLSDVRRCHVDRLRHWLSQAQRAGGPGGRGVAHSPLIFAALTIGPHSATSDFMMAVSSPGVALAASTPSTS